MKKLSTLDHLLNDWIFDCTEPRAFSSTDEDNTFLIKYLQEQKVKVDIVRTMDYFYCTLKTTEVEVSADSRANLCPRSVKEAVCLATLKLYIPQNDILSWNKIHKALIT